ncbi:MAG TPA: hypothetical protein VGH07_02645 [Chthoniobacterales bacterium]
MAETKLENNSSDQLSDAADGLTRRELLKRGGKIAAAAAVSSAFPHFLFIPRERPQRPYRSGSSMPQMAFPTSRANGLWTVLPHGTQRTM